MSRYPVLALFIFKLGSRFGQNYAHRSVVRSEVRLSEIGLMYFTLQINIILYFNHSFLASRTRKGFNVVGLYSQE